MSVIAGQTGFPEGNILFLQNWLFTQNQFSFYYTGDALALEVDITEGKIND